uniref:Uncharacterized protein n=1 Tax=Romanomermis culicivorax TaxID=13658 RepID=A0A915J5L6_ROMCU
MKIITPGLAYIGTCGPKGQIFMVRADAFSPLAGCGIKIGNHNPLEGQWLTLKLGKLFQLLSIDFWSSRENDCFQCLIRIMAEMNNTPSRSNIPYMLSDLDSFDSS